MRGSGLPRKRTTLRSEPNNGGIGWRTVNVRAAHLSWGAGHQGAEERPESGSSWPTLDRIRFQGVWSGHPLPDPPAKRRSRGGDEHGEKSLGVLAGCEVKRPAEKVGGESPRPDKIPLQARFGTTPQAERLTERRGPRLRWTSPIIFNEIGSHGNTSRHFPGNPAKIMLYSTVHPHLHPALSKKRTLRPGLGTCPSPGRLINC